MNIKNKPLPRFEVPSSYEKYAEGGYLMDVRELRPTASAIASPPSPRARALLPVLFCWGAFLIGLVEGRRRYSIKVMNSFSQ